MKALKKLKSKIKWFYNSYIWNPLHYSYMKRQADNYHKMTGKRYFVAPATETRLMVVDNSYVKAYNKHAKKTQGLKPITIYDLIKMAYYATSTRSLVNG